MKLSDLRTPPPLRDSDYAAIRARVMAEIAHDRRPRPFWRLAFALAAMLAAILWFMPRGQETAAPARRESAPVVVAAAPAPPITASNQQPATSNPAASNRQPATGNPAASNPAASNQQPAVSSPAARVARRIPKKQPRESIAAAPIKIEIHTTDPDIRIIWIVNPDNAREES